MPRFVIDTDMGVDDAMAVAYLLAREAEICGVAAVWGNTSAQNATANVIALLDAVGRGDVPVVAGAEAPLARPRSRVGALVHGSDGLWGAVAAGAPSRATTDVLAFYRSMPRGATLIALGPLTNLAFVARADPDALRRFERIVVLGGARHHGAMTPVSETNFWHDPDAAEAVLSARLPITLVTRDAHRAFALSADDVVALTGTATPAARLLAAPIRAYAEVTTRFGEALNFPDVVAAAVALDPGLALDRHPALVRVVTAPQGLTRGQSIIGITVNERLTMIADGAAAAALVERMLSERLLDVRAAVAAVIEREPVNAHVVLAVDARRIRAAFMGAMSGPP